VSILFNTIHLVVSFLGKSIIERLKTWRNLGDSRVERGPNF